MRNLKIKERAAELELNKSLYPLHIVEKAAKDFEKVFSTSIETDGRDKNKIKVYLNLKGRNADIVEATYNFLNYLIAELKNDVTGV